ncbi:MAG: TraR/DksA family transcriptional regulator [Candidatus Paceibacteria bacterium]
MQTHEQYKKILTDLKIQLTAELSTIAIFNEKTGDWEVRMDDAVAIESDSNDLADFGEEADERIATLAELETRYRNIDRALKKLEGGTFGVCEISGEKIEEERLTANPAARTCIAHREEEYDLPL